MISMLMGHLNVCKVQGLECMILSFHGMRHLQLFLSTLLHRCTVAPLHRSKAQPPPVSLCTWSCSRALSRDPLFQTPNPKLPSGGIV